MKTLLILSAVIVAGEMPRELATLVKDLKSNATDVDSRKRASKAQAHLTLLLLREPSHWAALRPALHDMPAGKTNKEVRGRLVSLLLIDRDESSIRLLQHLLRKEPGLFTGMMLIRLDKKGVPGARAALRKQVKDGKDRHRAVYAALHLALDGDRTGEPLLVAASKKSPKHLGVQHFCTAIALKRLGRKDAWPKFRIDAKDRAKTYLESGNLEMARIVALQLEFFGRYAESDKRLDVVAIGKNLHWHLQKRRKDVHTKQDVAGLLG